MLGKIIMKEKKCEAYLGDILSSEGLRESIEATIKDRTARVKGSIYELRSLIEDFRMQAVGGMMAAIDLYEACIVPSLLTNCGTWTEISEKEENLLDETQNTFCRAVLQVPVSSPKASLRAVFGLTGMKWRVMEAKVLLILAIRRQEEGGLALEVLQEQMAMGFPGLGQEVRKICLEVGLPDATTEDVQREDVKKCIQLDHLKHLKCDMARKDKLEELAKCDTRVAQDYVSWTVKECRMAYRLQTKMFKCRANMQSRYRRDVICRACRPNPAGRLEDKEETQDHLEVCGGYSECWEGLGPMTPQSRVRNFFLYQDQTS